MNVLVSYAINHNDQSGEHVTMHNTSIEFNGPAAEDFNAADVLNRLIWALNMEDQNIHASQITLINYWII
jgi:hypothetical protein